MKAAVISLGSKSSQMTLDAMRKVFSEVDEINIRDIEIRVGDKSKRAILNAGEALKKYDCIYAKGSFRYAPILRSLIENINQDTYSPIEPNSYIVGHDKILTHLALQNSNIPMPQTYLISSAKAGKKLLNEVTYPIVMKFPHGTQGIGVMVADSFASASSMLDALIALRQPFLIQEYIETDSTDIRAFVVGDEVVAAVKRTASKGEVRANVHMGGIGKPHALDTHAKRVAIDAAKALGAEICAIDMLEGPRGPLVIEVNISPGLQGITKTTGKDIAGKIASHLAKRTQEFKVQKGEKGATQMIDELSSHHMQQIITHLNFRADRILLPKIVTDLSGFTESDELVLKVEKGRLVVERL